MASGSNAPVVIITYRHMLISAWCVDWPTTSILAMLFMSCAMSPMSCDLMTLKINVVLINSENRLAVPLLFASLSHEFACNTPST